MMGEWVLQGRLEVVGELSGPEAVVGFVECIGSGTGRVGIIGSKANRLEVAPGEWASVEAKRVGWRWPHC